MKRKYSWKRRKETKRNIRRAMNVVFMMLGKTVALTGGFFFLLLGAGELVKLLDDRYGGWRPLFERGIQWVPGFVFIVASCMAFVFYVAGTIDDSKLEDEAETAKKEDKAETK